MENVSEKKLQENIGNVFEIENVHEKNKKTLEMSLKWRMSKSEKLQENIGNVSEMENVSV